MLDTKERKLARLTSGLPDRVSVRTYNLLIGAIILYGFLVNALIVKEYSSFFLKMNPVLLIIGCILLGLIGIFMACSSSPVMSFIGYNLVVIPIGALLSVCLPAYSAGDILLAIVITGIVVATMMLLSTIYPHIFSQMGRTLFFALLISTVSEIVAMIAGYIPSIFNWIFVVIFSLYIGYDWHKAQAYPKTIDNAVDSALDIYLDIINLFIRILRIIGKGKRKN